MRYFSFIRSKDGRTLLGRVSMHYMGTVVGAIIGSLCVTLDLIHTQILYCIELDPTGSRNGINLYHLYCCFAVTGASLGRLFKIECQSSLV